MKLLVHSSVIEPFGAVTRIFLESGEELTGIRSFAVSGPALGAAEIEIVLGGVSVERVKEVPRAPWRASGWRPLSEAPDGARVLLGPRHAPVVGVVHQPLQWEAELTDPTCSVVHYNDTTLVAGYRCSEWHALPEGDIVDDPVLSNGLTRAETSASRSVAGLTGQSTSESTARKPLTEGQILAIDDEVMERPRGYCVKFARAIERAHGIGD